MVGPHAHDFFHHLKQTEQQDLLSRAFPSIDRFLSRPNINSPRRFIKQQNLCHMESHLPERPSADCHRKGIGQSGYHRGLDTQVVII